MANEYLVSLPTAGEFHKWCRAMNVVPMRDAFWVPQAPPARREEYLKDRKVANVDQLIGDFSDAEKAALVTKEPVAKASAETKAKPE